MDAQTVNQTYDLLTLALGDTKLKQSGAFYIGPCPFCGGRDRFNLRHTPEGWRWFCRKCGNDKYHGPIDYLMRRENLDFKQALDALGGDIQIRPRVTVTPQPARIQLPDQAWRSSAFSHAERANDFLVSSPDAQQARDYLQSRALNMDTWMDYVLGFAYVVNRPAISIPWMMANNQNEIMTIAVGYRFIDDPKLEPRYWAKHGSTRIVFGMLQRPKGDGTLIIVEGEFNAMSIAQVCAKDLPDIDVLSFGGESQSRPDVLRKVAKTYKRVIVWKDNAEKASALRSALERHDDIALCSPEIEGTKYDANALLQKGWLADFLCETIGCNRLTTSSE